MKRIISVLLVLVLALSMTVLTACGPEEKADVKLGLGVVAEVSGSDYEEGTEGTAKVTFDAVAVLVDKDGKVVACDIDALQANAKVGANGAITAPTELKTKRELGNSYGMSSIGKTEWYAQADALESVIVGKTVSEIKALVAEGGKGTEEVQTAGCTIAVSTMIEATVKAIENATVTGAKEGDSLKVAITGSVTPTDPDGETAGKISFVGNFAAAAKGEDGKVTAMYSDSIESKFAVTFAGVVTAPTSAKTKGELGTDYGMSTNKYATDLNGDGKVLEWNEQVAAFDALCVGKDANGIKALAAENGYGVEDVQNACCTIAVADIVKTAAKAAE